MLKWIWVPITGKLGSMSYNFVEDDDTFVEGINLIQAKYSNYDRDKLKDTFLNKVYSVEMVRDSLVLDYLFYNFLHILIFDALIGNSDRHHSNWGLLINIPPNIPLFAPIYDNGSSLCSYEEEISVKNVLKDKMRFEAMVFSKSKATIGFDNKRPVRHFELVEYLSKNYYNQTAKIIGKIKRNITEEKIDTILSKFDSSIMSNDRKKLVKMFLMARKKKILDLYFMGD